MSAARGTVSVCLPVHDDADRLDQSLESVWAQTSPPDEVVIVDDASTDDTAAVLARHARPGLRVITNATNEGQARATTRAVAAATGDYVKLLHSDDRLLPGCLETMRAALDREPSVGFVACRRVIELEDPDDPAAHAWADLHRDIQRGLGDLRAPVVSGPAVVAHCVRRNVKANWIAEPTGVMFRRDIAVEVGGMHLWSRAWVDVEWWYRMLCRTDVAFLDDELYVYRFSFAGVTRAALRTNTNWLAPLWVCESIIALGPGALPRAAAWARLRIAAMRVVSTLLDVVRNPPRAWLRTKLLGRYLRVTANVRVRHRDRFWPEVPREPTAELGPAGSD